MLTLNASTRETTGKNARLSLLKEGFMPAVVYGPKQEAISITLPMLPFKKILRDGGESSVITLTGLGKDMQVLIQDVDHDPVTSAPRHADLYAIEKGAKVEVAVTLVFTGESPAVKAGANLVKVMHELEIEADPSNLPHEIEVDISKLALEGDQIHVSDIKLPHGVTLKVEGEEIVALIQAVAIEAEEESAGPDMDAIEVEAKGKTETEEEAA